MDKSKLSSTPFPPPNLTPEQRENSAIPAQQLPIKHHAFGAIRELGRKSGRSTRNPGSIKFIEEDANGQKIASTKILSRSIGFISKHIRLPEDIDNARTATGESVLRTHTEAALIAAATVGKFDVNGEIIDISGQKPVYSTSANQPCERGAGHENCKPLSEAPPLSPMAFFNPYKNHDDALQTVKLLTTHDEDKFIYADCASETDSDSDLDPSKKRIIVIDSHSMAGRDFNLDKETPIRAIDLKDFTPEFDSRHPTE